MADNKQARGWCFTINNPNEWDKLDIEKTIADPLFKFLIYGEETGDGGNFHYQGYVHFNKPFRFKRVKMLLPRAHLEQRRGTVLEAVNYCKKDGVFREFGELPQDSGTATKEMWKNVLQLARAGKMSQIEEDYPAIFIRYLNRLISLRRPIRLIQDDLVNEWWYGKTGTGKSRKLWTDYPEHFSKELNKWWCGYEDEEIVGIEEWSPSNACTGSMLKVWSDRYPFTAQIKGGNIKGIRPKKIIVLSNYTIKECFPDPRDHEPLLRRFKCVHFKSLIDNILDDFV